MYSPNIEFPGRFPSVLVLTALSLIACGGGEGGTNNPPPPPPPPVTLAQATASGNAQTGTVGAALALPLRVVATRSGAAASGVTVTWGTSGTGAAVTPPTSVTDAQGIATTTWTLAQNSGAKTATASVSGATGSPITFTATATAGAAANISLFDGNNQTGAISTALGAPIRARVADQFDNPVTGASVAWSIVAGGGVMSAPTTVTNATGIAAATWTLGAALGAQMAQASGQGLTGSPLVYSAIATSPPVGVASIIIGDDFFSPTARTVTVGTAVTWTMTGTTRPHSVRSLGAPSFPSSVIMQSAGLSYSFTFSVPGVYNYDCEIHGSLMTGTITVQ